MMVCSFLFFFFSVMYFNCLFFFFQAEDGIRDGTVTGVQTCALPIWFCRHRNTTDYTRALGFVLFHCKAFCQEGTTDEGAQKSHSRVWPSHGFQDDLLSCPVAREFLRPWRLPSDRGAKS